MPTKEWLEMEAQAAAIRHVEYLKQQEIEKKLEEIRKYNREHPIPIEPPVVVHENETDPDKIALASAAWIGYYHRKILGNFGFGSKKE